MTHHSHAIVGDGITALAFLETCLGRGLGRIAIIGPRASQLGRGLAYAKGEPDTPWRYAYLLNSPADDIDPEFAEWLADQWPVVEQTMANRRPDWLGAAQSLVQSDDLYGVNAPREIYGDFMELRAQRIIETLRAQGTQVEIIDDIATDLALTGQTVTVHTGQGRIITAQSADIAPGGPETMRFDGDDGPFSAPSIFGYEDRISEHIKAGAEIFCIGGNATMLDVLRLCQSQIENEDLKFAFCAPEGEIPPPLVPRLPRKLTHPRLSKGHASAAPFLAEIRREIDAAEAAGDTRREIRAGFRAHFLQTSLNDYVSDPNEAAQVTRTLRFWLRGGTRDSIFDMRALARAGNVRIVQGHVQRVEQAPSGAQVVISDKVGEIHRQHTGFVVNCAGAGPHSRFDPLTESLLRQGLIRSLQGSGLAVEANCRTTHPSVRYLSPAVTQLGQEVAAMPLFDAHMLRTYVSRSSAPQPMPSE